MTDENAATFEEKVDYFRAWQHRINQMDKEVAEKLRPLEDEFRQKAEEIQKPLLTELADYKMALKKWAGITDGEKTNIVEMLSAVRKVMKL